ncbi:hypothetical protein [Plesiomonas sp. ZOR0011]|uniref:hypothetical protein n=1 Tax=Plesiomonas sp. ZOR0011 TaxID=1339230 RepID=UPI00064792C3|nr:hypothetical protein [Plesiomonas sp. ZOR0011]
MSTMLVNVIRAEIASGISKKSGTPKPYSFARVIYQTQAESFVSDDHNIQRSGLEEKEISMINDMSFYSRLIQNIPAQMNLILSPDPKNPARNIVSDFELV